jgi:hypothetical protein
MKQEGIARNNPKELLRTLRRGLTLLPKPPLRLGGRLLPVRRNKSPCSTLANKVHSLSLLFVLFPIPESRTEILILDFSEFKDLLHSYSLSKLARFQEDYALKHSMLGRVAVERLAE